MIRLKGFLAVVGSVMGLLAVAAPASAVSGNYCTDGSMGVLIGAGNACRHGTYHGDIRYVEATAQPNSGAAGTWISNSSGTRVSAADYCGGAGCYAMVNWYVPNTPAGFATAYNNSTFTSRYRGFLTYQ